MKFAISVFLLVLGLISVGLSADENDETAFPESETANSG